MRALVISAGANKSAYTTGVLKFLLGDLENKYDIICGNSSGAIIAAILGMYKVGQEKQSAADLEKWWLSIDNSKIYKKWKFWGSIAAIWKPSMYDSTPLQNLIRNRLNLNTIQNSGKTIAVGCLSINSMKYHTFTQDHPEFINATIASCAYPGAFLPVKFKSGLNEYEESWSDSGSKSYAPIQSAIDLNATHIDIIHTSPEQRDYIHLKSLNILSILQRSFDASIEKISTNDLSKLEMYNQLALAGIGTKKYIDYNIFRPKHNLTANSLDFDPKRIKEMIALGYSDAITTHNNT